MNVDVIISGSTTIDVYASIDPTVTVSTDRDERTVSIIESGQSTTVYTDSNPNYVTRSQTGDFVTTGQTGNFITTSGQATLGGLSVYGPTNLYGEFSPQGSYLSAGISLLDVGYVESLGSSVSGGFAGTATYKSSAAGNTHTDGGRYCQGGGFQTSNHLLL